MSSGCGDVLSLEDLKTAKKHQTFEAEVITGKSGGVAGGGDITEATSTVTGQKQKTLPAIMSGVSSGVNSQLAEQQREFEAQIGAQQAEFADLLAESGYSWLADYVDGPVTFTNRSQVTVYEGVAYRLAANTPLGFTTSGVDATSFNGDKAHLVAIGDNDIRQQVDYKLGQWLPDAMALCNATTDYSSVKVRGFYAANDGGDGVWEKTGGVNQMLSGRHIPIEAKIYNGNGVEYQLLVGGETSVNLKANGAKVIAGPDALTSDDFVCLGEVHEGIAVVYGMDNYDDSGGAVINSGATFKKMKVTLSQGIYRIGKHAMDARSGVSYDLENSLIRFAAHSDFTYDKTGKRINGLSNARSVKYWRSVTQSWDLASWNNATIKNAIIIGDHTPAKTRDDCTGGLGLEIINPQHVTVENVVVHRFLMDCVAREWNAHIPPEWGKVRENMTYITQRDDDNDYQQGHFYGVNFINCQFLGSRDGTFINICDWVTWSGGNLFNQYNWRGGVDGIAPLYFVWQFGSKWSASGGQAGVYHDDTAPSSEHFPYTYAPEVADICESCQQSDWGNYYNEWCKVHIEISGYGATRRTIPTDTGVLSLKQRYTGLRIAMDSVYKPTSKAVLIKFGSEMFGAFSGNDDTGWVWNDSIPYSRGDVPRALSQFTVGSPVPDDGAFLHGGYDFKFGPYNMGFGGGAAPDVDSLRGSRDRSFMNDLGFVIHGGSAGTSAMLPLLNPAYDSNVCIIYKVLAGDFDPKNILMNEQSYLSGSNMTNTYISVGNDLVDYGNGWRMAVVRNLRPFGYSEERGWSPQNYLRIPVPAGTSIILKLVRAYQGGVPIYPSTIKPYTPQSQCNGMWGTQTSLTECDLYPNKLGGGIFRVGDDVEGWLFHKRTSRWNVTQDVTTYGYPSNRRFILQSAGPGPFLSAETFTATIISKGTSKTEIQIQTGYLNRVCLGVPIYIASSTGTIIAGRFNLTERVYNSDGTPTNKYFVNGLFGAVGDVLTLDNSKITLDFQPTLIKYLSTDGWINVGGTLTVAGVTRIKDVLYAESALVVSANFRPVTAGATSVGTTTYPFKDGFFQNAITVVSDENHKPVIEAIPEEVLNIFDSLSIKQWKYDWAVDEKGEENARWHTGFVAQEILSAFSDAGLDATKYAFIVFREWEAQEAKYETVLVSDEVLDEESGLVITPAVYEEVLSEPAIEARSRWEIVPHEVAFILSACHQRRLKKLESLL